MPISISLGLTVFTGIERFEIMAVPFFILAGNFLTHGGIARRMIDFATSVVGHWHGGLALAGIVPAMLPWTGGSPGSGRCFRRRIWTRPLQRCLPSEFHNSNKRQEVSAV